VQTGEATALARAACSTQFFAPSIHWENLSPWARREFHPGCESATALHHRNRDSYLFGGKCTARSHVNLINRAWARISHLVSETKSLSERVRKGHRPPSTCAAAQYRHFAFGAAPRRAAHGEEHREARCHSDKRSPKGQTGTCFAPRQIEKRFKGGEPQLPFTEEVLSGNRLRGAPANCCCRRSCHIMEITAAAGVFNAAHSPSVTAVNSANPRAPSAREGGASLPRLKPLFGTRPGFLSSRKDGDARRQQATAGRHAARRIGISRPNAFKTFGRVAVIHRWTILFAD